MSKPNAREFLFSHLAQILGDGGLAQRDGFKAQAGQRDYAQHWCEAIVRSIEHKQADPESPAGIVMASADTGTGKTIGYAVPLLLRAAMGVRVGIATHSHALQRQFLGVPGRPGDLVTVAKWIHELGLGNLKIRRRLGRGAFISLAAVEVLMSRMKAERKEKGYSHEDLAELDPLIEFAMNSNAGKSYASGLLEDLIDELGGELPLDVTAASICLSNDASEEDAFRYKEHLEEASGANVIIFSHAYIASCAQYRSGKLMADVEIDSLVIDEADRLVDVAASTFRSDLSLRRCEVGLARVAGKAGDEAIKALKGFADYVQSLHERQNAQAVDNMGAATRTALAHHAQTAQGHLNKCIANLKKKGETQQDVIADLTQQERILSNFVNSVEEQSSSTKNYLAALSFSPVKSLPSISVIPIDPGKIVARLWNLGGDKDDSTALKSTPLNSVLLTSATLGVPGTFGKAGDRFSGIARDFGIYMKPSEAHDAIQRPELDLWASFEPEKFGRIRYILADPNTPNPTLGVEDEEKTAIINAEWVKYATDMIVKARESGGRTLVLCSSYKEVDVFAKALIERGETDVIEQMRGGSLATYQDSFVETPNAVWLSPTAWEGVNLPGMIANLVVLRIPFTGPDEVTRAMLLSLGRFTHKQIDSLLHGRMMNGAKRKLRQGFGRPIRKASDQASIWIADPRFPMHSASQIPLRFPTSISYSGVKQHSAFHGVVPLRFNRALEHASVLLKNGDLLK